MTVDFAILATLVALLFINYLLWKHKGEQPKGKRGGYTQPSGD